LRRPAGEPAAARKTTARAQWRWLSGRYQVVRSAVCPDHPGEEGTAFVGVVESGWLFVCSVGRRYFVALPAPGID
jgi:hypothetical protein